MKNFESIMSVEGKEPPKVDWTEGGYLFHRATRIGPIAGAQRRASAVHGMRGRSAYAAGAEIIDLTRFGYERVETNEPCPEMCIL